MTRGARALARIALLACAWGTGCATFGGGDRRVELAFEGNRELGARELSAAATTALEDFDPERSPRSSIDDAAFDVERRYHARGFPFATVAYRYEPRGGELPLAVFTVDEGPRTELVEVRFAGNAAYDADDLVPYFSAPEGGWIGPRRTWYVESRVADAAQRIERLYQANGYLDASVAATAVEFSADRSRAVVTVVVVEGAQRRLASVEVEGAEEADVARGSVEATWEPFLGNPFFDRVALEIEGRIEELLADRGYPEAEVERVDAGAVEHAGDGPAGAPPREPEPRADGVVPVALRYRVVPGPRVRIAGVEITGAESTQRGFLLSRIELEPGELYSRKDERASFRRLYQTGLFEHVRVGLAEGEGAERAFEVELEEAPSLELFLEPGWGSYEKLMLGAGLREKNLAGSGRILRAEGTLSTVSQTGRIGLTDPWFLGSDVAANVSVFGTRRQEPSFERLELGTGIEFTRRFSRTFGASLGYQYRRSDIADVEVLDAEAQDALDDVDISSVTFSPAWDTRDNPLTPNDGTLTRLSVELASDALGSQLTFVRLRGTFSTFRSLGEDAVAALSLRGGVIAPYGPTDTIPLQERFFNGGENTVRSFQEDELGPLDANGEPLGGEAYTVLTLEARRRLVGRVEGALFYDVGNVTPDAADFWDFAGYEQGIGIGLRYLTPVGPIRLDGALNPDPEEGASDGAIHFSVGMAF